MECAEGGLRSTDDKSCSGRYIPYCEDNLSCSVSLFESIWDSGRARLFEVERKVRGSEYRAEAEDSEKRVHGESTDERELAENPELELQYIAATPRMALYIEYSVRIYRIYLKYVTPEDIHVYSIDEVFIDATAYLRTYGMTAKKLAEKMIRDVLEQTGITATAGLVRICIYVRLRWILWRSGYSRIRMV